METLVGAVVFHEVVDKTLGLLQQRGNLFAPKMLPRYEESNLSPESSQSSPRGVESSAGVALQSAWGYALTLRWDGWDLVPFVHGRPCRVALLNNGRDRSCVGISFPTGVIPTAGKVRLKSCDCPAKSLPPMAWHSSFVLSHLGTAFSLEVTGCVSCGSFYQSLHCDILSFPPPSTAVVPHHCLACAIATAFTDCGLFIQVCVLWVWLCWCCVSFYSCAQFFPPSFFCLQNLN